MWDTSSQEVVPVRAIVSQAGGDVVKPAKTPALVQSEVLSAPILPTLPFLNASDLLDPGKPAVPLLKPGLLKEAVFALSKDHLFTDRLLPQPGAELLKHCEFPVSYYLDLHRAASASGSRGQYKWPAGTPNYLGARLPLQHTAFNLDAWRKHLIGYKSPEFLQL